MRLNTGFSAKAAYYDRNPLNVSQNFVTGSTPPHGSTSRWNYTVPTGRKAWYQGGICGCNRQSVAAPVGEVQALINYGNAPPIQLGGVFFNNNVVDAQIIQTLSMSGVLLSGESHSAQTQDLSTGGGIGYQVAVKMFEFDA